MIIIKPDYYDNFKCLAGECPMSCCKMWQIVVDEDSLNYYNSLTTDYGKLVQDNIEMCDGDYCFKVKNGRCAFLNEKDLCNLHINLGADYMAKTCRKYPDFTVETEGFMVVGQSLSCPYVAEQIISNKNKPEIITEGKGKAGKYEDFLYTVLCELLSIIFDKSLTYKEAVERVMELTLARQKYISSSFGKEESFVSCEIKNVKDCVPTLEAMEFLTAEWKIIVEKMSEFTFEDNELLSLMDDKWKRLLWYFIYRYFMESSGDGNILFAVKFSAVCVEIIQGVGEMLFQEKGSFSESDLIHISYLFAREIEHSEENLNIIFDDISLGII